MTKEELDQLVAQLAPAVAETVMKSADRSTPPAPIQAVETAPVAKSGAAGFARLAVSKAIARRSNKALEGVVKDRGDTVTTKALVSGTISAGGALVLPQYSDEFIDLLRANSVVRAAGAVQINLNGRSLTFGRLTGSATVAFVGEGSAASASSQTFDQLTLVGKSLVGLVDVSNDLLTYSPDSAEAMVQNDLLKAVGAKEDATFLIGTGSATVPNGIFNQVASGNQFSSTEASSGSATYAEVKADIYRMKAAIKKAGAKPSALFINSDVERYLLSLPGPGGDGSTAFENEMNTKGTIAGVPYFVSDALAWTGSAGSEVTDIGMFDMSEVLVGDAQPIEVETFPNTNLPSDLSSIRVKEAVDIALKHDKAGAVLTCAWGRN